MARRWPSARETRRCCARKWPVAIVPASSFVIRRASFAYDSTVLRVDKWQQGDDTFTATFFLFSFLPRLRPRAIVEFSLSSFVSSSIASSLALYSLMECKV